MLQNSCHFGDIANSAVAALYLLAMGLEALKWVGLDLVRCFQV